MKREIKYFHLIVESKLISCDVVLKESKLNKFLKRINKSIRSGYDKYGGIKVNIEKVELKFKEGDGVKVKSLKSPLTITTSILSEGKRYWFVKERTCAILEENLVKINTRK